MKPLMLETDDAAALQELGRASVQIVHDLKNQLNGLKLYATFLRKRLEKTEGRADELETVAKLLAGLERAAADMNTLVRYGRPIELRCAPHVDLRRTLAAALERELDDTDGDTCCGEIDQTALAEALKQINTGLNTPDVYLRRAKRGGASVGVIEWRNAQTNDAGDMFNSFAGGQALRLALAAKVVRAHGGTIEHDARTVRVCIPLKSSDE